MRFDDYISREYDTDGEPADNMVGKVAVRVSAHDAKLIRKSIIEEMEAVNDYIERASKCENDVVRKVFLDIAEEERIHFGEFEMLLEAVDPLHEPSEDEAEEELEDMFGEEDDEDEI